MQKDLVVVDRKSGVR